MLEEERRREREGGTDKEERKKNETREARKRTCVDGYFQLRVWTLGHYPPHAAVFRVLFASSAASY